jgi:hypothetical protein
MTTETDYAFMRQMIAEAWTNDKFDDTTVDEQFAVDFVELGAEAFQQAMDVALHFGMLNPASWLEAAPKLRRAGLVEAADAIEAAVRRFAEVEYPPIHRLLLEHVKHQREYDIKIAYRKGKLGLADLDYCEKHDKETFDFLKGLFDGDPPDLVSHLRA